MGQGGISLASPAPWHPLGLSPGGTGWGAHAAGLGQGPAAARPPGRGRDPATLVTHGRTRLSFIMGKNLLKCLIRD